MEQRTNARSSEEGLVRLIALGTGPAFPAKGGATSGYLVMHDGTSLLMDCGTGVVSNLQRHVDFRAVTAVIISHMHADHFFDLIPYRYGLRYAVCSGGARQIPLYLPPSGFTVLRHVVAPFAEEPEAFWEVFEPSEYDPNTTLRVNGLTVRFARTRHLVPTFAMSVEADGRKLAYSADSAPSESLVALSRNADLFLCEASLQSREQDAPGGAHMTATEAGVTAARAGVGRLLLTHIWHEFDGAESVLQASKVFGGPVEMAIENESYEV